MRKKLMVGLLVSVIAAALAVLVFREPLSRLVENAAENVMPNCAELPAAAVAGEKARELEALHLEVARITDGAGAADFDTQRCPGRVELHIAYPAESDKPKLVDAWQHSSLRDIPVHWQNV